MYVCMRRTIHASDESLQGGPFSAVQCMDLVVDGPIEVLKALAHTYIAYYKWIMNMYVCACMSYPG